jgi:hypothetical protein
MALPFDAAIHFDEKQGDRTRLHEPSLSSVYLQRFVST